MNLGFVLGWKFDNAPGIRTRKNKLTAWPADLGPPPTAQQISDWTAEFEQLEPEPTTEEMVKALFDKETAANNAETMAANTRIADIGRRRR